MKTIRIIPVVATLLFGVGSILVAAPALAWSGGNGFNNGWNNGWANGWSNGWQNGWMNGWSSNGFTSNGTNSGERDGDHALRVIGIELPAHQLAK